MNLDIARRQALSSAVRNTLAAALTLGVALPLEAGAQESTAGVGLGEITVTGSRPINESEAAALAVQRESDVLIAVAAADAIGRLPDQNVAQAAGRLPGVAVQRDQGQARYLSLRGAPINWTTLSIDGIGIVSPEGRDTRFDSLPSAIASQVIVRKAVTPDMTAETIAGNIDIRTRSAFDYPERSFGGKLGAGYAELGSKNEYEGSLVYTDRYAVGDGEIGFVVSGSYYERDMITDNFETDWEQVSQDLQPGSADRIWARETENKLYRLTRKNYSGSGRLEWRTGGTTLFGQSIYTAFTDDEARDNYIFDLDDRQADNRRGATPCTIAPNPAPTNSGYADVCIGNTPQFGTVYGIDINQRATERAFVQSIFTNTLGGDHELQDTWKLGWRLNFTRSTDDRSVAGEARYDSPSTRNLRPTVQYDLRDPDLARVQLFRTIANTNGTFQAGAPVTAIDDFARPLSSLRSLDAVDTTEAYTAKVGASHELPLFGGRTTVAFGGQFERRAKEANEAELLLSTPAQFAAAGIPTTFLPVSLDERFQGEVPLGYTFRYYDRGTLKDMVARADAVADFRPIPGNFYDVREKVLAGYLMSTTRYGWGSVVGGARVEQVENRSRALASVGGALRPIEVDSDDTSIYPSVHVNYDFARDQRLRLSLTTGASRPDFDQLRPNFTFDDSARTVSGGNPNALPEKATGLDAYWEWYVQPQGYVMFGAFYKDVRDVLFTDTKTFGSDVLNTPTVDRSQYTFSTLLNGGSGHLYGLEAAVQQQVEPFLGRLGLPDWMGGFGIIANLTLNESEAEKPDGTKVSLPGTSDVVYNVGVYYEKYRVSARLNYQRRSEWLDAIGSPVDGGDQYWAADDELDFSVRYGISRQFEVYFDAVNLLDNAGRRYSRDPASTIEWERFGRRYIGGLRVSL